MTVNRTREALAVHLQERARVALRAYPSALTDLLAWRQAHPGPAWLFTDMGGAVAAVRAQWARAGRAETPAAQLQLLGDAAAVQVLAPWRIGRGVYEFDPDLLAALWGTPLRGEIPGAVLLGLPEFAVYLVLPAGVTFSGVPLPGVWAALDVGRDGEPWLRLLLDLPMPGGLAPLNLSLPLSGTLDAALQAMLDRALVNLRGGVGEAWNLPVAAATAAIDSVQGDEQRLWAGVLSLLLYVCSAEAEHAGSARPRRAGDREVRRARHGAAAGVQHWVLGARLGAQIREARSRGAAGEAGSGGERRPHWRGPRWTTVWTGRGKQIPEARWEPGLIVRADRLSEEEQAVVVRRVQA